MHNVCLNQGVGEYLPKTSLFPKEMHETILKTVKKRSVKLAKMPWHQVLIGSSYTTNEMTLELGVISSGTLQLLPQA